MHVGEPPVAVVVGSDPKDSCESGWSVDNIVSGSHSVHVSSLIHWIDVGGISVEADSGKFHRGWLSDALVSQTEPSGDLSVGLL